MWFRGSLLYVAAVLTLCAADRPGTVSATAEAIISARPDFAQLSFAVTSTGATAQKAVAANADRTTAVLNSIRRSYPAVEIKTTGYNVDPQYTYPQGKAPILTGYHAANTVQLSTNDVPNAGKLIDAAVQAGVDTVNGISFQLKDDAAVRADALTQASRKAKQNAEVIAKALGLRVTNVIEAGTMDAAPVRPIALKMMRTAVAAESTPVEPGTLDYSAHVTVTLGVSE